MLGALAAVVMAVMVIGGGNAVVNGKNTASVEVGEITMVQEDIR